MKSTAAIAASAAIAALALVSLPPSDVRLVWNRTVSAPKGLYLVAKSKVNVGDWAVLSADAASAQWIANNGYLGPDWPIIKRVAASEGDEICRSDNEVSINENLAAIALDADSTGRKLPRWQGCFTLGNSEVFLLNNHPRSLDGRYFGWENRKDLLGRARLLFRTN
ncbi:MAG TPA: S26 family signal peptidase [Parvularculaceae bacterium]|nr:S26 family signal peptidase [Amphiplicatus sp.]HPE30249.1 S26 family signal peptidase [Parvularculaceae bacterium]